MNQPAGFFEAFINQRACRPSRDDKADFVSVQQAVRTVLPGAQLAWAGSQRKGTAIQGSDLDVAVSTGQPVTIAQRRAVRAAVERALDRSTRVGSHAVRVAAAGGHPGLDLSFTNAAFGSRPAVDAAPWTDAPTRQQAARALKIWLRAGGHPKISGWVVEALVLHLDSQRATTGLALFNKIVRWLAETAKPADIEAMLRPRAHPAWNPVWSKRLPGRLEALRNAAQRLRSSRAGAETWRRTEDVARWLGAPS